LNIILSCFRRIPAVAERAAGNDWLVGWQHLQILQFNFVSAKEVAFLAGCAAQCVDTGAASDMLAEPVKYFTVNLMR
jgi:hypothetical protein